MSKSLMLSAAAGALVLLAGCGSSNSTTSSSASASNAAASNPSTATTSSTPAASGVLVATKHGKLGTILAAGPKKLTVYLFEGDKGAASSCSGACASAWPPVTTAGAPQAGTGALGSDLGTIARTDGSKQVTYKGHPLYYFVQDKDAGDAYGQGAKSFGAGWYVLAPDGNKVDNS